MLSRAFDKKLGCRNICQVIGEGYIEGLSLLFALQFCFILKFLPSGTFIPDIPVLDKRK